MRKSLCILLVCLLVLSACGSAQPTPYSLDQAHDLLTCGAFEGSDMAPLDDTLLRLLYRIEREDITECIGYIATNSSVSADELVIFICPDEEAAVAVEEACHKRVDAQLLICESYCPAAVPRLEKALVHRRENTVLLMVGDPDVIAAQKGIG